MNNPDKLNRYAYVIHAATYLNENCQTAKKRCLYFKREMCNFLGFLSGTNQFVCQDNICNINQQSNVWLLCHIQYTMTKMYLPNRAVMNIYSKLAKLG